MPVTYNKLFHLLIDLGMKKGELQKKANITASIMARLAKNETVRTDTIGKICEALECQPGDIMEFITIEELMDGDGNETEYMLVTKPELYNSEQKEEIVHKGILDEDNLL